MCIVESDPPGWVIVTGFFGTERVIYLEGNVAGALGTAGILWKAVHYEDNMESLDQVLGRYLHLMDENILGGAAL